MPLVTGPKDKPGVQQYVNRVGVAPTRPPQRSLTPQPNSGRERSLQGQDANRRKSQGPSYSKDKENMAPPSRGEAAALKLDVPDTRPKSKLAQVTQPNTVQRQSTAQHNIYAEQAPVEGNQHNVRQFRHFTVTRMLTLFCRYLTRPRAFRMMTRLADSLIKEHLRSRLSTLLRDPRVRVRVVA